MTAAGSGTTTYCRRTSLPCCTTWKLFALRLEAENAVPVESNKLPGLLVSWKLLKEVVVPLTLKRTHC